MADMEALAIAQARIAGGDDAVAQETKAEPHARIGFGAHTDRVGGTNG